VPRAGKGALIALNRTPAQGGFHQENGGKCLFFAARRQNGGLASLPGQAQHPAQDRDHPAGFAFRPQIRGRTKPTNKEEFVMQVRHILRDKGPEVIAILSTASLAEAAGLLSARKIGALTVKSTSEALCGIISERDLVRAIAAHGATALADRVENHMTRGPVTCTQSDSVEMVMETMTRGRFRHVPVLDEDHRVCGMISIGDVVKTRIAETVNEAAALRDYISATA
jgi:CBS domain-containing protein